MDGVFAPWHIIVLVVVLVVLFGSRRLPGAARSLGQSMHIFKQSVSGLNPDNDPSNAAGGFAPGGFTAAPAATPPPAVSAPTAAPVQQDTRDPAQDQFQDLQRQVAELQRQSAAGNAGQPSQPI